MRPLVITSDVATRITRGLSRASTSRIGSVGRVEEDSLGVEVRYWGDVVGTLVMRPVWYYRYFNVLKNVGRENEVAVDEALAWYRGHAVPCRVTVSPFESSEGMLAGLSRRGLRPVQFMSVLCRTLDGTEAAPSPGVTVRELARSEFDVFLNLWLPEGPGMDRAPLAPLVRAEFADWRCYVALVDGVAAAHAALYLTADVAVLAGGGTRPEFRGRGCQRDLLRRRLADAYRSGCALAVTQATPATTSQRNMERVGFQTAYTELILADSFVDDPE